ncbi:MAG: hypothetical protein HOY79_40110 [Streptomyces sp.]|nr:hypothetical protein [Streptomyces sp.]
MAHRLSTVTDAGRVGTHVELVAGDELYVQFAAGQLTGLPHGLAVAVGRRPPVVPAVRWAQPGQGPV